MRKAPFDALGISQELDIALGEAERVIAGLEAAGFISRETAASPDGTRHQFWEITMEGNGLAMATAARPVKRRTADRVVARFLERVAAVNDEERFAYRVARVTVFGSYLTDATELNDVDLLVDLVPRSRNAEKQAALERSSRIGAARSGRRFGSMVDELGWPETEVRLFLKHRSRTLSLHYTDHALVRRVEHRVIFDDQLRPPAEEKRTR